MNIALSLVIAYLLGSIPFAYIISRQRDLDIRLVGDRNVGAFNVFRHGGLDIGLVTLMLDIGKGAAAIIIANALHVGQLVVFLVGIIVVAGHNWPVFLRFRGGRGGATVLGVLFTLVPWELAITLSLGILVLFTTRKSIWVGMVLFIPLPFICFIAHRLSGEPPLAIVIYTMILPCLSGITHWLTTWHLPPDAKKEAATFWIANPKGHQG